MAGGVLNGRGNGVDAIDSLNVLSPQLRGTQRLAPPRIAPDDPTQIRQQFGQDMSILLTFLRCNRMAIDHFVADCLHLYLQSSFVAMRFTNPSVQLSVQFMRFSNANPVNSIDCYSQYRNHFRYVEHFYN